MKVDVHSEQCLDCKVLKVSTQTKTNITYEGKEE